jgi:hypothetical protein
MCFGQDVVPHDRLGKLFETGAQLLAFDKTAKEDNGVHVPDVSRLNDLPHACDLMKPAQKIRLPPTSAREANKGNLNPQIGFVDQKPVSECPSGSGWSRTAWLTTRNLLRWRLVSKWTHCAHGSVASDRDPETAKKVVEAFDGHAAKPSSEVGEQGSTSKRLRPYAKRCPRHMSR